MATNALRNKVIFGDTVLIDLTADTVTPDNILAGFTANDQSGAAITGTCEFDVDSGDAQDGDALLDVGDKTVTIAG